MPKLRLLVEQPNPALLHHFVRPSGIIETIPCVRIVTHAKLLAKSLNHALRRSLQSHIAARCRPIWRSLDARRPMIVKNP